MSLNVGDSIGDYQVIGILGAGGMGKVYKVRNTISDRVEAMKILLPNLEEDAELADRFVREIKVQASLDHPHIAGLHTAQRAGGKLFMLMEFVEGETIEAKLRRGPIPLREGIEYVRQVLLALAYAHSRGVVHRDIKPANMIVTPSGQAKLMDFGIARIAADQKLTQTGRTVGSLSYMSPEQINGAADIDGRSDLYSLGITLYEIATGRRPFQGDSDYSIMAAHLQATPVPPVEIDPRLPRALNDIILMAIAKDPAKRFQTADAFARALESVARELAGAPAAVAVPIATAVRTAPLPPPVSPAVQAAQVPQPAPPAAPAASAARSRRLLYMSIGSIATIVVLVFAATQLPKWRQAEAGGQTPVTAQPAAAEPTPAVEPSQLPPAEASAEAVAPAPAAAVPARAATEPQRSAPAPAARVAPPSETVRPEERRAEPEPSREVKGGAPPAAATPPSPQQVEPAAPAAELRALRERMMLLATRLGPLNTTIQNMQRRQAASGLGMRQDIVSAQQRAAYYLDEAENALRAGNLAAGKNLDSAEREIEKLERFLGR